MPTRPPDVAVIVRGKVTVTSNVVAVRSPASSVAVTVTVATPSDDGPTVSVMACSSVIDATTTSGLLLSAAYDGDVIAVSSSQKIASPTVGATRR